MSLPTSDSDPGLAVNFGVQNHGHVGLPIMLDVTYLTLAITALLPVCLTRS